MKDQYDKKYCRCGKEHNCTCSDCVEIEIKSDHIHDMINERCRLCGKTRKQIMDGLLV